jgi:GAF domain-containing protein
VPAHIALALRVGGWVASTMRVPEALAEVCRALPDAVEAAGAVIILAGEAEAGVLASDAQASWLGEVQRRAGAGPWAHALRSGRTMVTPDLTRVGPPDLAAAAAEGGLVSSVVVPLVLPDRALGGLQLLGDAARPVGAEHVELIRPLVATLTARLIDVVAIEELIRETAQRVAAPETDPGPVPAQRSGPPPQAVEAPPAEPGPVAEESGPMGWFGPVEPRPAVSVESSER